jgi:hypothetical protein
MTELQGVLGDIFGLMGKNRTATKILIGLFAGFAAAIVVLNAALKTYEVIAGLVKLVTKLWRYEQLKLNLAFLTNPLFLLVAAIAALVVGIIIAYKRVGWFRDAVNAMFRGIVDAAKWLLDFFKNNWQYIVAGIILGPFGLIAVGVVKHWDEIKELITKGVEAVLGFLRGIPDQLLAAGKAVGQAVKDGIVDGITGVANAVWGIVDNIRSFLSSKVSAITGWGRDVGEWLKGAVVNAVVGVASGVWSVISGIPGYLRAQFTATLAGWQAIGGWIRDAVVDGLTGFALGIWGWMGKAKQFLVDNKEELVGMFKTVGGWIKDAVIDGLTGLAKELWQKFKGAFSWVKNKFKSAGGLLAKANPFKGVQMQAAAAAGVVSQVAPTAGLMAPRAGEGGTGALAGAPPPLYNLKQLMGAMGAETPPPPPVEVRVFIGDTELKGIVRTEVRQAGDATARVLLAATSGVA